ncbi:MAG TPA: ATP-binding cassette domain-containing protein [bacterium]|nr:ATP-binding cassette domain-containing protein [bacterium]
MDVMIELSGVSKSYGQIKAAENISFKLNRSEILGFLGPNGAGKTTAMKIITGFMPPDSGSVKIKGEDVSENPVETRKNIGYLPENNPLYTDMTVEEYLRFIALMRGLKNIDLSIKTALSKCGIFNVRHRIIGHLSKGYKQRVGLAQAIIHDPEILILDEPVNGLDPKQIAEIRTLIRELGKEKTVILCSHILSEVEAVADRVLIINEGKIVADNTIENLRDKPRNGNTFILELLEIPENLIEQIKSLAHVNKAEMTDAFTVKITAAGEKDTANMIFETAAKNRWKLSQLYLESNSLENMFLDLTEGGKQ